MRHLIMFLAWLWILLGPCRAADCQAIRTIGTSESLANLADFYFGDTRYGPSILLATNMRSADSQFSFIGNPDALKAGSHACIPAFAEAEKLRLRYESYSRAVAEMIRPEPWEVSRSLVALDPGTPANVVTWIRSDQLPRYKAAAAWVAKAPSDIWVTVVPRLRTFCQNFTREHGPNLDPLTLRLEQRLGLPPGSGKTTLLEILIRDPSSSANLFRPCVIPAINTSTCPPGPPAESVDERHRRWFYQQYYWSYAVARPSQYPWTTLGYTFDWAPSGTNGTHDFVRYGESEFVIPSGAPIEIQSATDVGAYCAVQ